MQKFAKIAKNVRIFAKFFNFSLPIGERFYYVKITFSLSQRRDRARASICGSPLGQEARGKRQGARGKGAIGKRQGALGKGGVGQAKEGLQSKFILSTS